MSERKSERETYVCACAALLFMLPSNAAPLSSRLHHLCRTEWRRSAQHSRVSRAVFVFVFFFFFFFFISCYCSLRKAYKTCTRVYGQAVQRPNVDASLTILSERASKQSDQRKGGFIQYENMRLCNQSFKMI